jgi:AcrR family transcriptional regulator
MYTNDRTISLSGERYSITLVGMDDDALEVADGRIRRGDETRRAVLGKAVEVASVDGLDGLSIGRLAAERSISKSGLFAHFGAKEQLQLATIRAARRIFADAVVAPAMTVPPGLGRIWAISESWLAYSRRRVFPGGCFFAKATHEFGGRPGTVRDALVSANHEWSALLERTIEDARLLGDVSPDVAAGQLAFELNAFFESANVSSLLGDEEVYAQARESIQSRLQAVASPGAALPWAG